MTVTPENAKIYRCKHGEMFKSAQEAAFCNLQVTLAEAMLDAKSVGSYSRTQIGAFKNIPDEITKIGETKVVAYWLSKLPGDIEAAVRAYIDDCAVGMDMAKKPEGETP